MVVRTFTFVTLMTIMVTSSGCGGMRNFLFGRGARCGLCSRIGAVGNALNPLAPPPNAAPNSGCGLLNGRAAAPTCQSAPVYAPQAGYAPMSVEAPCNQCIGSPVISGYGGDCGCQVDSGYGPTIDPYLQGGVTYGQTYPVEGGVYSSDVIPGSSYGGVIQSDNFQARKYDARGDEIISESPLPPGAQLIN